MSDLSGFRDYNTDDGEEYWNVDIHHAIDALYGEMETWPEARVLNHTTGEIFEGRFAWLIKRVVDGVKAGHDIRVEAKNPPKKEEPPQKEESLPVNIYRVVAATRTVESVDATQGGWPNSTVHHKTRKFVPGVSHLRLLLRNDTGHEVWIDVRDPDAPVPAFFEAFVDSDGGDVEFVPFPRQ